MSVEAMSWAFAQEDDRLASGTKFLLVAVANRADKSGVAFPGHQKLADDCSCRLETVSANLKRLDEIELIARFQRRRRNGSRTSDWIVLGPVHEDRRPMIDAPADAYPELVAVAARAKPGSPGVSSLEETPAEKTSAEDYPRGHLRKTGGPDPSEEPSTSPPNPLIDRVVDLLNDAADRKGAKRPKPETIETIIADFPDVDHEQKAKDTHFHLLDGNASGRRKVNVALTFRNFCKPKGWESNVTPFPRKRFVGERDPGRFRNAW